MKRYNTVMYTLLAATIAGGLLLLDYVFKTRSKVAGEPSSVTPVETAALPAASPPTSETSNDSPLPIAASADTIPPSVPMNFKLKGDSKNQTLALSWSASTDNMEVAGYKVYDEDVLIATVTETSHLVKNVGHDETHVFTVRAFDAAGNESEASDKIHKKAKTKNKM